MHIRKAAVIYLILFKFLPLNKFNVYNYLWRYYGASITKYFGECVKTHLRLYKLKHDLDFMRTCKREQLLPNFTRIRLANPSLYNSKLIKQCRFNILQAEIKFKKKIYTQTYRHLIRLNSTLKENVPPLIFARLKTILYEIVRNKMIKVEKTHEIKLQTLRFKILHTNRMSTLRFTTDINNNNMSQTLTKIINVGNNRTISTLTLTAATNDISINSTLTGTNNSRINYIPTSTEMNNGDINLIPSPTGTNDNCINSVSSLTMSSDDNGTNNARVNSKRISTGMNNSGVNLVPSSSTMSSNGTGLTLMLTGANNSDVNSMTKNKNGVVSVMLSTAIDDNNGLVSMSTGTNSGGVGSVLSSLTLSSGDISSGSSSKVSGDGTGLVSTSRGMNSSCVGLVSSLSTVISGGIGTESSSTVGDSGIGLVTSSLIMSNNNTNSIPTLTQTNDNSIYTISKPLIMSNKGAGLISTSTVTINNTINSPSTLTTNNQDNGLVSTLIATINPTFTKTNDNGNNSTSESEITFNIKPVTNLSSRILSTDEINALSNGLHHVYASGYLDQASFVCNIENFYAKLMKVETKYRHYEQKELNEKIVHQLTPAQLDIACQVRSISNIIKNKAQLEMKTLRAQNEASLSALRNLANDRSIVITKPDKGRGVVLMDRSEYIDKMEVILNDPLTFKIIDNDPTLKNEMKLTRLLLKLNKQKFLTDNEYHKAKPSGSRPARIYGLPKLHKLNQPLRPVMSATKTVAYGLGKVLSNRLSHLRNSPYVVKDSFDFVKKIRSSHHTDKRMVSFDVVSLFTKIPLSYTLTLILNQMYPKCKNDCFNRNKRNKIKKICDACQRRENFHELLKTATSEVNFLFNGKMYVQHNGVAMGAPIAPIISDIFMSHLETTLMEKLKENGIYEWHRFVDDTFVLIDPNKDIQEILAILNNFHESIQFTYEVEANDMLSFLDVKVHRTLTRIKSELKSKVETKLSFETTVYRKSTYTGLMINWFSFVPLQHKKASIVNMIQRAISICSNYKFLASEFDHIRKVGMANAYSLPFIEQHIAIGLSKYLKQQQQVKKEKPQVLGCSKEQIYFELPYLGNTTDILKDNLKRIIKKYKPSLDARFYVKSPATIHTLFKIKDPINKLMQSDIVYGIKCQDCQQTYVGKTERQMITRLLEHGAPQELKRKLINRTLVEHNSNSDHDNNKNEIINTCDNVYSETYDYLQCNDSINNCRSTVTAHTSEIETKSTNETTTINSSMNADLTLKPNRKKRSNEHQQVYSNSLKNINEIPIIIDDVYPTTYGYLQCNDLINNCQSTVSARMSEIEIKSTNRTTTTNASTNVDSTLKPNRKKRSNEHQQVYSNSLKNKDEIPIIIEEVYPATAHLSEIEIKSTNGTKITNSSTNNDSTMKPNRKKRLNEQEQVYSNSLKNKDEIPIIIEEVYPTTAHLSEIEIKSTNGTKITNSSTNIDSTTKSNRKKRLNEQEQVYSNSLKNKDEIPIILEKVYPTTYILQCNELINNCQSTVSAHMSEIEIKSTNGTMTTNSSTNVDSITKPNQKKKKKLKEQEHVYSNTLQKKRETITIIEEVYSTIVDDIQRKESTNIIQSALNFRKNEIETMDNIETMMIDSSINVNSVMGPNRKNKSNDQQEISLYLNTKNYTKVSMDNTELLTRTALTDHNPSIDQTNRSNQRKGMKLVDDSGELSKLNVRPPNRNPSRINNTNLNANSLDRIEINLGGDLPDVVSNLRRSDRLKNKVLKKYNYDNDDDEDDDDNNNNINNNNEQISMMTNEIINAQNNEYNQSKENNDNRISVIKKHQNETKHKIGWESTKLLWSDNNPHKLLIKESLMIKAYEPELNRTTHSVPLYIYPNGLDKKLLPRFDP
jgi:hypothetical protein